MNKQLLAVLLSLVVSTANAANGGEGNNTGCNGVGNTNSPCAPGGTVIQPTVSPVITVPSNNSNFNALNGENTNNNSNSNLNLNNLNNTSSNVNNNSASAATNSNSSSFANGGNANSTSAGGNSTAAGGNAVANGGAGGQGGAGGNSTTTVRNSVGVNSSNTGGNSNVVIQGDQAQERNPVSSAYAPSMSSGYDQCLVPIAAGMQAVGFGITVGHAVRDENCEVLKLARTLVGMNQMDAALKLLRQDPRVDAALKAVGR